MESTDTPWVDITGVPLASAAVKSALDRLDHVQRAWKDAVAEDPAAFAQARLRALRSHAIETGILERLYDVDWGLTTALVAEGLALDVVERSGGGVTGDVLTVINDQYQALEFVTDAASRERSLTVGFIRELHQLITRHQATYDALDPFGHVVAPPLLHGEWKFEANHLRRPDGSQLEFCPPLRVQDQMEQLVRLLQADESHPVVRAAWLHHRFISIHPFQDGNGRVARALLLLELLRAHHAPVVVRRDLRADYIGTLDLANRGELDPFIIFVAQLETQAMLSQAQGPVASSTDGSVLDIARAAAGKIAAQRTAQAEKRAASLAQLAEQINGRVELKLRALDSELQDAFRLVDPAVSVWITRADIGDADARHYYAQVVKMAKRHDFFANLTAGSWWTTLTLRLFEERLRLLVATVRVGRGETGLGAVLVQAERVFASVLDEPPSFEWLFEPTGLDRVDITGDVDIDSIWPQVEHLVDKSLTAAMAEFTRNLG